MRKYKKEKIFNDRLVFSKSHASTNHKASTKVKGKSSKMMCNYNNKLWNTHK